MAVEPVGPRAVLDLFRLLASEQQVAFLRLLGSASTAESLYIFHDALPPAEHDRYSTLLATVFIPTVYPVMAKQAYKLLREHAGLPPAEFERMLDQRVRDNLDEIVRDLTARAKEQFKGERERKSNPGTIRRNVEICDLRRQDRKKWSLGKLAKRYGVSVRAISLVLEDEEKWRRLAAEPGRD